MNSKRMGHWNKDIDERPEVQQLFKNIVDRLPTLEKLLAECSNHWGYEDSIYRFYHQSYKLYSIQNQTLQMVDALQSLLPDTSLNDWFKQIIQEGTEKKFSQADNEHWLQSTRLILEAFFHARFFLEMAVKYGKELKAPPNLLPSGWAALLYLYNLR
jgi:hypothetical protein